MKLPALYPIIDVESLQNHALSAVAAAEAMLAGGARMLQFRHKGHFARPAFEQAAQIGEACARYGALWIVDDRPDIAKS